MVWTLILLKVLSRKNCDLLNSCASVGNASAQYLLAKVLLLRWQETGENNPEWQLVRPFLSQCSMCDFYKMGPVLFLYLACIYGNNFIEEIFPYLYKMKTGCSKHLEFEKSIQSVKHQISRFCARNIKQL
ncbi:PREDICTED: uncharacterized protein LOC109115553 [Nelumbo nucifera]|uniref:Uncharacterized protein LOC109115553 n=1 Tax=Nelumbo nucifera TaxID=4432 RepID=A0A1U8Q929_NELNU|nr:PREDICTED: uncharacterized protein LOC109115553 [Nelumbo nucifera]